LCKLRRFRFEPQADPDKAFADAGAEPRALAALSGAQALVARDLELQLA
jgi:hypothetical protein